jgi:hypothetical protein
MVRRLKNLVFTTGTEATRSSTTIYEMLRIRSYSTMLEGIGLINEKPSSKPLSILQAEYIIFTDYKIYPFVLYRSTSNGFVIYLRIIISNIIFEISGRRLFKAIIPYLNTL